ncbi:DUF6193 family natural product biosynthesis protein [Actinophytocola sp.]|uniref:DUF6193 family natural product biosynthesis protein n=1 Tax=Actinophytocola sp. TaxID=1872138 RepID=UPI002ED2DD02
MRKGDRGVDIVMGIEKRVFIMQFWAQDVMLTKGSTAEMRAVAGAAHVWLTGATVRQLNATWPFVKCSDWAEAVERGEATEFRWRRYLTDPLPPHMVELGPFIVAAAREPRLRALYPFTSHLTLRFRPTIQPVDAFDLCVIPLGDGIYRVVVPARREMGTGDASTSVRLALTMLHD